MMVDRWVLQREYREEGVGDLIPEEVMVSLHVGLLSACHIILHELQGHQQTFHGPWRPTAGGRYPHGIEPVDVDVGGNGDDAVAARIEHERHQTVLKEIALWETAVGEEFGAEDLTPGVALQLTGPLIRNVERMAVARIELGAIIQSETAFHDVGVVFHRRVHQL